LPFAAGATTRFAGGFARGFAFGFGGGFTAVFAAGRADRPCVGFPFFTDPRPPVDLLD